MRRCPMLRPVGTAFYVVQGQDEMLASIMYGSILHSQLT